MVGMRLSDDFNETPLPDPTVLPPSVLKVAWLKLQQRKLLISAIALPLAAGLITGAQFLPRSYKSTASVVVESLAPRTINGLNPDQAFSDVTIGTEVSILNSREMFVDTVSRLHLLDDAEFNTKLDEGMVPYYTHLAKRTLYDWLGWEIIPPDTETVFFDTVSTLRTKVHFNPIPLSRVIEIIADSRNKERSAQIANTFAALFVEHHEQLTRQVSGDANQFLKNRLEELRTAASAATSTAEKYRVEHGLLLGASRGGKDTTLTQETATGLNEQLLAARNKLGAAQAAKRAADGNPELLATVLASPTIAELRKLEAEATIKRAALVSQYGANSQLITPLNAQIDWAKKGIAAEADRQKQSLNSEVVAAQDNVNRLEAAMKTTGGQLEGQNMAQAHLDTLVTESLAAQSMYSAFLGRAKETDALRLAPDTNVRIVSQAATPVYPAFPQNKIMVPASGGIALAIGCAFAFLLDRRQTGILTLDELQALFALNVLGAIPWKTARPPSLMAQWSAYEDAIEHMLSRITVARDNRVRSVLITSPNSQEGKSTIAKSLADAASARGQKVLLLQADFRSTPPGGTPTIGFSEILRGVAMPGDAMRISQTQEGTSLTVISPGQNRANPVRLLSSPNMQDNMHDFQKLFDLVVVDGPPVLAGGDCWLLSQEVDYTVLLVRAGTTPREDVAAAINEIQGGARLGIALNMVGKAH